ncbi:AAA family ATPase [Blastococcus saxobsidens]|uniref:CO dehydrogenase maturation factor n=1 Tax=Blastococcus saxobsidens TaxID=138336 RepID=A0A4Q7Y6K6_9ACTN|nr:AAA family ATPase [Blastococcus saxobsidens]RZU31793.1 CO dehydrogenase maturation factor [Blastococcus saxobsidens]
MATVTSPRSLVLGVVGKGGVGKTTVAALLARAYADRGRRVVAIDTDSNPNLGLSLGLSPEETDAVPVLPRSAVMGNGAGASAGELLAEYGRSTPAGPTLLSAIRVAAAGAGCTCGGHATVRSLLADALEDVDLTLVDMEAGLEHLSRAGGTLAHADLLLVVCEPTRKSVLTAVRTAALAGELGIPQVLAVGNKARTAEDAEFLRGALAADGVPLIAVLPYDAEVAEQDRAGITSTPTVSPAAARELDTVVAALDDAAARLLPRP